MFVFSPKLKSHLYSHYCKAILM